MDAMTGNSTGAMSEDDGPKPATALPLPLTQRVTRIVDNLKPTPRELWAAEAIAGMAITSFGEFTERMASDQRAGGEAFDPDKALYIGLIAATFRTNERRREEEQLARATPQHVMATGGTTAAA